MNTMSTMCHDGAQDPGFFREDRGPWWAFGLMVLMVVTG